MTIAPIRRSVEVAVPVDTAFALFTAHIGAWWPLGRHSVYGEGGLVAFEGDRLVERSPAAVSVWAEVVEWDPPHRFRLAWHAGHDASRATDLTLSFEPRGWTARSSRWCIPAGSGPSVRRTRLASTAPAGRPCSTGSSAERRPGTGPPLPGPAMPSRPMSGPTGGSPSSTRRARSPTGRSSPPVVRRACRVPPAAARTRTAGRRRACLPREGRGHGAHPRSGRRARRRCRRSRDPRRRLGARRAAPRRRPSMGRALHRVRQALVTPR